MIGTQPVQAAIYAALVAAHVVDGDRIVDGSESDPARIVYPYVQIGEAQTLDDDVVGSAGSDEYLTLHIWSRQRGQKEVKEIAGRIAAAMRALSLAVEGFDSVTVFTRDLRVLEDPDGLTRHGVFTLHIHAFQKEA
jgi:hypothetical protein